MASAADTKNRKSGSSEVEITFNHEMANAQRDKTVFRAHKVALDADPYNPARLSNAIIGNLSDPA